MQAFSIATTGFTSSSNCQIGTAGMMALALPRVMTPREWIGIVMACSDTQGRTSADGRSAVIRCSGRRRSAPREPAHELRASFGRGGVLNGRRHLPALVNSDDGHGRDSMCSWECSR